MNYDRFTWRAYVAGTLGGVVDAALWAMSVSYERGDPRFGASVLLLAALVHLSGFSAWAGTGPLYISRRSLQSLSQCA